MKKSISVISTLIFLCILSKISLAQEYTYTYDPISRDYNFSIYTGSSRGEVADEIAYRTFRHFLAENRHHYAFYKVVQRTYSSPYSKYTVRFYKDHKIDYGY